MNDKKTTDLMNENPEQFKGMKNVYYFISNHNGVASSMIFDRFDKAEEVAMYLSETFDNQVFTVNIATPSMVAEIELQKKWEREYNERNRPDREFTDEELEAKAAIDEATTVEMAKLDEALEEDEEQLLLFGTLLDKEGNPIDNSSNED